MDGDALSAVLVGCQCFLPESFRKSHVRLFVDEHVQTLTRRLVAFHKSGVPESFPSPHLAAETTPPLATAWAPFRDAMELWVSAEGAVDESIQKTFARSIVAAGTPSLLILLGQRLTPASVSDTNAIPPTRNELLQAATAAHNTPGNGLTVAARALSKHVNRSTGEFWGEVTGSNPEKNAAALSVLETILANTTWWNVFGHYTHEFVYEARVPSGHGARWNCPATEFIGFLEPFEEAERLSAKHPAE
ncbi:MAG: hypothetical protein ACFCD0_02375 [Gemmataceae bacterium]